MSFQRLEIDVVSTYGNRRRFNVYDSTSFQRLEIHFGSMFHFRRRIDV